MGYDPTYRRSWATDFEEIHADVLTADARRMLRSLPSSLRAARHDLAVMPPEDAVDALVCLQDLAAMLAAGLAAANKEAAEAQAALKQAQDDGRLMLAHMDTDVWCRMGAAGRTRYEQDLDHWLRNSLDDTGEGPALAELYAARRLLALGNFFDNPRGPLVPVAALVEPEGEVSDGD